jgi:hypothetical protein
MEEKRERLVVRRAQPAVFPLDPEQIRIGNFLILRRIDKPETGPAGVFTRKGTGT